MPLYKLQEKTPQVHESVFIAPTATLIGNVRIGSSSSVWFNTVIRGDLDAIVIGANTNIQDLSMLHVDTGRPLFIDNQVTVGHRCILHGCHIEENCLIGMGAIIMNGAQIGKGSIVAAGSVILENTVIPPQSLVTGVPGKVKRSVEQDMLAILKATAMHYVETAQNYQSSALTLVKN